MCGWHVDVQYCFLAVHGIWWMGRSGIRARKESFPCFMCSGQQHESEQRAALVWDSEWSAGIKVWWCMNWQRCFCAEATWFTFCFKVMIIVSWSELFLPEWFVNGLVWFCALWYGAHSISLAKPFKQKSDLPKVPIYSSMRHLFCLFSDLLPLC